MIGWLRPQGDGQASPPHRHDLHEFHPGILGVEHAPPSPLPRVVLRGVLLLLAILLIWAAFGRLDIVAVAEGKLVPMTYLKIVQPAEAGIVREIQVKEGEQVRAGQILVRMDANLSDADSKTLHTELQHKALELRRVQAELAGQPFRPQAGDAPDMFRHVEAEYLANRHALEDQLAEERATLERYRQELAANQEVRQKLEQTLPSYRNQEQAYAKLGQTGFAGNLMVMEKQRERIEKEQDLKAQEHTVQSLNASIAESGKRLAQIHSNYRQKLQLEKTTTYTDYQKLQQEWAKQEHRNSLLELKAPQAGIVKDLATHTPGTVVSPGTVLMTLVPVDEPLQAEVWLKNEDAGFVHPEQTVKLKLSAYPFQKYGMVDGEVTQVSADASDTPNANQNPASNPTNTTVPQTRYRTLIRLQTQQLVADNTPLNLTPGMQVAAEIKLADQTVLEYLLSPVRQAFHEAGRER